MAEWQWQIKLVVGLKPKQQLIKFLVVRPWAEIGRKSGGRRVLALIEQLEGEGIEYGNWMVGMGGRGWRGGHISSGGIWSAWNIPEKLQLTRGSKYANTDSTEDDRFCHLECLQSKKKLWRVNQVYNKVSGWWLLVSSTCHSHSPHFRGAVASAAYYSLLPPYFTPYHYTRLDPTALHCTSEWVGELSESVSSPETGGIAGQIKPDTASGKDQFSFNPFTHSS